jgi:hypothetical protein
VGLVLENPGRYKAAEAMHRQTQAVRELVLEKEHLDTLMSINSLGEVLGWQ